MNDPQLHTQWEAEVATIRERIRRMRELFVKTLKEKGMQRNFSFITKQNGMFSFSGLTKDQVNQLRKKYSVYIVGSGRINVAGMTPKNMDCLCEAIADVLQ
jgi:aspartate/tyrosine/aromatic aminotransferase